MSCDCSWLTQPMTLSLTWWLEPLLSPVLLELKNQNFLLFLLLIIIYAVIFNNIATLLLGLPPAHVKVTSTSFQAPSTTAVHPIVWRRHFLAPAYMNLLAIGITMQYTTKKPI